ncbi:MAG: SOS response-associated peptidase [Rhizomicrobium sp.]|jgi:putative SOS response-associated peptidase YedK
MCGKFTQMMSWGTLVHLADLVGATEGTSETVTPMRFATIIRLNAEGARETARMRWGFVPRWEKDPIKGAKFIHARAETLDTKRAFADAFANRRGLLVVRTFNEGKEITPKKTEQHVIIPRDGRPLAIAVLWERWGEAHAGRIDTFAMVTVPANALIGTITDRMPAIVLPENWNKWLGEEPAPIEELKDMLRPFDGEWDMRPENPAPPPRKPSTRQPDLF